MEGCTDGTLVSTGQKFFSCLEGRGMYYPLAFLQPDMRFVNPNSVTREEFLKNRELI